MVLSEKGSSVMSVPEKHIQEQQPTPTAKPDESVTAGTVAQLGPKNLAQLVNDFSTQAGNIGSAQGKADSTVAKMYVPLLRTLREILLQNQKVAAPVRVKSQVLAQILVEKGVYRPRVTAATLANKEANVANSAMTRPRAMVAWSWPAEFLGTSKPQLRIAKALKDGVEYQGATYYTPIEMLEKTDVPFGTVFEYFNAVVQESKNSRSTGRIPKTEYEAAENAVERFSVKVRVRRDPKQHPKGYKQVKVLDSKDASLAVALNCINAFAGSWSEDEKARMQHFINLAQPEVDEEDEEDEEEAA